MHDRLEGPLDRARQALTIKGQEAFSSQPGLVLDLSSLDDVTGYYLLAESTEKSGRYSFTYRIHRSGVHNPYAVFWDEVLTVLGKGAQYSIDDVVEQKGTEAVVHEDMDVYLASGGEERRLFGMDDLPDEWIPPGMPPDSGFGIGKEGYVLLSFAPAGDRLAFVTWGTHGFLGVFDLPGSRLEGVDLHFEGLTVEVRWSPTGLLLAAVVDAPTGNKALYIYDMATRQRVATGLETLFHPEEFDLDQPRWTSATTVGFVVKAAEGSSQQDGPWQFDAQTKEIRRQSG
jgi:hypothetical protein